MPTGTLKRFEVSLLKTLWACMGSSSIIPFALRERERLREGKSKYSSSHSRIVHTWHTLREGYPPIIPWRGAAVEVRSGRGKLIAWADVKHIKGRAPQLRVDFAFVTRALTQIDPEKKPEECPRKLVIVFSSALLFLFSFISQLPALPLSKTWDSEKTWRS